MFITAAHDGKHKLLSAGWELGADFVPIALEFDSVHGDHAVV